MMTLILLVAAITTSPWPNLQHHWAPLLSTANERVDIDTAAIETLTPDIRRVWLRWNLDAATDKQIGADPQYELEHRDLDCAQHQTRVIEKRRITPTAGAGGMGETLSSSETAWHRPAAGSLLDQVLNAGCR